MSTGAKMRSGLGSSGFRWTATAVFAALATCVGAAPHAAPVGESSAAQVEAARRDFVDIHRVLLSPRCRNCHPAGNAPLQGDAGTPHGMNISRASVAAGLQCTTCHRGANNAQLGAPPGTRNWHMPSAETPMVFEGRTPAALCLQLKDSVANGKRALADLVHHVEADPFVLWGWQPGLGRAPAPFSHAEFVGKMKRWVAAKGPCPAP